MIRLFLVRHGQTAWSAERRYQGSTDIPLNETGLRQAEALARHFAAKGIAAIYSSDLQRALQTAAVIGQAAGLAVIPDARFRETSFGEWEGKTYMEMQQQWPRELAAWQRDPIANTPPGGESLADLLQRAASGLRAIEQKHQDQTVLVVAHGGVLRAALCSALDWPSPTFWRIELGSASFSELHLYGDTATIALLNDRHIVADLGDEQTN